MATKPAAHAANLQRRAERYAGRYSAEQRVALDDWDSPIPYPTDERMAEAFRTCVRVPAVDEYPAIRAAIFAEYPVAFYGLRAQQRAWDLGHTVESDPPHGLSSAMRWTCTACGEAVLLYGATIYGGAVEKACAGSQS